MVDSQFESFVKSQQEFYELTATRLRVLLEQNADLGWFQKYFGAAPAERLRVVPLLTTGVGSFGPKYVGPDGSEELYSILGVFEVDASAHPQFGQRMIPNLVHEVAHSYVNPLISKFTAQLEKSAPAVYAPVSDIMRQQAYGAWKNMVNESVVRASVARYIFAHQGKAAAVTEIKGQQRLRFLWTGELFDLLGEYERNRERYPTFDSFGPRIVSYFEGLAPRVNEMVRLYEESRPKVVSTQPPNGAEGVDPASRSLRFVSMHR